jgi:TonB-dependent starch-binding outer membrane protein SusC
MKLSRLRFYVQVVNLFTITNYTGLDPELYKTGYPTASSDATNSAFGIDYGNYPNNQKKFLIGLTLGL